ncbi:hypothetical protein JR316_0009915 [Psilocybe cubensis]|uniref:Uncharacterized protein n=2 Tax=Psilocybe cubensis TaxID=181762 RepID=A0ACB8GQE5_PSICU|nr:hypothetical protein JR316_0009915 [Psilocybe cubensis]KAH9477689.1 hypothetical protein JR316_0009915 [Psilocybe cubensis]
MHFVDLPPEIWHEIAQYLSPSALQHVRGVNRYLFDLAMDARYRDVRIWELDDYAVHVLDALQDVRNAQRVRRLLICSDAFEEGTPSLGLKVNSAKGRSMRSTIINAMRLQRHAKERILSPPKSVQVDSHSTSSTLGVSPVEAREKLAVIVPSLTSLTHFTVDWRLYDNVSAPYIDRIWTLHGSRLVHIGILATTTKMLAMFPLPPPPLGNVRSLDVAIRNKQSMLREEPQMVQSQLALSSFVNSLCGTLEKLQVSCIPMHDLSFFYDNLLGPGDFQLLSTLNLNVTAPVHLQPREYRATALLQRMGPAIRSLTLSVYSAIAPLASYQFTFSHLYLENLDSLTVAADVMAFSWDHTLDFLNRHSSTLRSLVIDGPIALEELIKLLTVVNHRTGKSNLAKLSLAVYQVNAEFFAILAYELYRLESLCLRIRMITSTTTRSITPSQFFPKDIGGENEHPFIQEMKLLKAPFADWTLNDITIIRRSCCGEIVLWGLLRLCAECIPSIRSFDGNGHSWLNIECPWHCPLTVSL